MFQKKDEFLHEFKRSPDWIESFNISIIDKKNSVFGFADIDYLFNKKKVELNWVLIVKDGIYKYNNFVDLDGSLNGKKITDKKLEYSITSPSDAFQLNLSDKSVKANLKLAGLFPIYVFPTSIFNNDDPEAIIESKLWNRYGQRCRVSGNITVKNGAKSGQKKVKVECFGQREHHWGMRLADKITSHSRLMVQFRDMSMTLTYMDFDNIPISNGVISRKSGNIPIQNVECELISCDLKNGELHSSEFSFTDAQDEVDLVVSKKIHSIPMPLPKNKRRKYVRFRNFSDFTIVGTNKKGVGIEEHLISIEKLNKFKSMY